MLSIFRRLIRSRVGVIVTLIALGVIALAFALTDLSGVRPQGGLSGTTVAEVGDTDLSDTELTNRVQFAYDAARRQQPTLDMTQFVSMGGVESVLDQLINGLALGEFAELSGMAVSKRAIDGEIASIPAFQGFDGKFSQELYERLLAERRITADDLRADIRREIIAQWLLAPTAGASQVPSKLALPYASLLLERRQGAVAFIPTEAMDAGGEATDQVVASFYNANKGRYMVPERRVIRYAVIAPDHFAESVTVSDAEIAQAYQASRARFAPSETRTLRQVIVADQNAAGQLAEKVKAGTSIEAAAEAAGLAATTLTDVRKEAYAGQSAAEVANAVFGAAEGAVVGPVRSPLGWHIVRVESVEEIPGKSLAEAREELVAEIRQRKEIEALTALQEKLDTGITDGATFDELMADTRLQAQTTPPLTESGFNPDDPDSRPDPALARIVEAAYAAAPGDSPQLVQTAEDGTFAVVGLARVIPAAPRPLEQIREQVANDYRTEQRKQAARRAALKVIEAVNGGTALREAMSAAEANTPPIQEINASRAQLAAGGRQLPPPVALMFSMAPDSAKLLEAPEDGGWFVVYLDAIERGDASGNEGVISSTRAGLGSVVGREYAQQFTEAAKRVVGVQRNPEAIAGVRSRLGGQGALP